MNPALLQIALKNMGIDVNSVTDSVKETVGKLVERLDSIDAHLAVIDAKVTEILNRHSGKDNG